MYITVWFRDLLRPKVCEVKVTLYEKGREKDINAFDQYRQMAIMKALEELWQTPRNSSFWFQAEQIKKSSCFKQTNYELFLTCYQQHSQDPNQRRKMNIPIRYRSKFLNNTYHSLFPEPVGLKEWLPLQVKFKLME